MKTTIREYEEEYPVEIFQHDGDPQHPALVEGTQIPELLVPAAKGRWVIRGFNEGHYNCVTLDLQDIIDWVKTNKPELLK